MQQVQSTETVQQRPHPNLPAMDISPPATPPPPGTVPVHNTADPTHTATVRFHPNVSLCRPGMQREAKKKYTQPR